MPIRTRTEQVKVNKMVIERTTDGFLIIEESPYSFEAARLVAETVERLCAIVAREFDAEFDHINFDTEPEA